MISFICLHWNKISLLKYLDVSFIWSIHIILEHMHMYGNCALQKAPVELWQQLKVRKTTHAGQQVQGRRTSTTHIDDISRCHQHFLVITVILMTVCSELAQRVADFTAERFYMVIFYRRTPSYPIAGTFLTNLRTQEVTIRNPLGDETAYEKAPTYLPPRKITLRCIPFWR